MNLKYKNGNVYPLQVILIIYQTEGGIIGSFFHPQPDCK